MSILKKLSILLKELKTPGLSSLGMKAHHWREAKLVY